MKKLKIFSLVLASCIILVAAVSFALPDRIKLEETFEVDAELNDFYIDISNLKGWRSWSSWNYYNTVGVSSQFSPQESGRGATMTVYYVEADQVIIKVAEEIPKRILKHEFIYGKTGTMVVYSYMTFERLGEKTKMNWRLEAKCHNNPLDKIKFQSFEKVLKGQMKFSIDHLKESAIASKQNRIRMQNQKLN